MKRFFALLAALGFVLAPAVASAQLAPIPNPVEYLDFVSASPGTYSTVGGVNQVVGPYTGRFLTGKYGSPTSAQFSIFCVDIAGSATDAWVRSTSLAPPGGDAAMASTKLGTSAGSFAKYTQAAYLSSLFSAWSTVDPDKKTAWSGIHAAIWTIMSGTTAGDAGFTLRDQLMAQAAAAYGSGWRAYHWYVLTPTDPTWGQEFLVVTPEPSTYLLLATGLLFLVAFGRKRLASRTRDDASLA